MLCSCLPVCSIFVSLLLILFRWFDEVCAQGQFKDLWANNADIASLQYAGTEALKNDFTRTGKR